MIVYTDGGARGNPGPSAIGIVLCDDRNRVVTTYKEFVGRGTNNQAEYRAVIKALELLSHRVGEVIRVFSDSQLLVRQLNGFYKVKNKDLKPLFGKVRELEKVFGRVVYSHVPRENSFVSMADELVNAALDES